MGVRPEAQTWRCKKSGEAGRAALVNSVARWNGGLRKVKTFPGLWVMPTRGYITQSTSAAPPPHSRGKALPALPYRLVSKITGGHASPVEAQPQKKRASVGKAESFPVRPSGRLTIAHRFIGGIRETMKI